MNAYHFFKKFRCGRKKGEISNNPTAKVVATDEDDAWSIFKEHESYRSNTTYVIRELGIAGAEEMSSGGQKNPGEWSVGDRCWTKLDPTDPEDPYHEGVIYKVHEDIELKEFEVSRGIKQGPSFTIWILGDYSSWRYRRTEDILLQPPKGKRRRRKDRPGKKTRITGVKPTKTMKRKKGS